MFERNNKINILFKKYYWDEGIYENDIPWVYNKGFYFVFYNKFFSLDNFKFPLLSSFFAGFSDFFVDTFFLNDKCFVIHKKAILDVISDSFPGFSLFDFIDGLVVKPNFARSGYFIGGLIFTSKDGDFYNIGSYSNVDMVNFDTNTFYSGIINLNLPNICYVSPYRSMKRLENLIDQETFEKYKVLDNFSNYYFDGVCFNNDVKLYYGCFSCVPNTRFPDFEFGMFYFTNFVKIECSTNTYSISSFDVDVNSHSSIPGNYISRAFWPLMWLDTEIDYVGNIFVYGINAPEKGYVLKVGTNDFVKFLSSQFCYIFSHLTESFFAVDVKPVCDRVKPSVCESSIKGYILGGNTHDLLYYEPSAEKVDFATDTFSIFDYGPGYYFSAREGMNSLSAGYVYSFPLPVVFLIKLNFSDETFRAFSIDFYYPLVMSCSCNSDRKGYSACYGYNKDVFSLNIRNLYSVDFLTDTSNMMILDLGVYKYGGVGGQCLYR